MLQPKQPKADVEETCLRNCKYFWCFIFAVLIKEGRLCPFSDHSYFHQGKVKCTFQSKILCFLLKLFFKLFLKTLFKGKAGSFCVSYCFMQVWVFRATPKRKSEKDNLSRQLSSKIPVTALGFLKSTITPFLLLKKLQQSYVLYRVTHIYEEKLLFFA